MKNFLDFPPTAEMRKSAISTAALPHCRPWLSLPVDRACGGNEARTARVNRDKRAHGAAVGCSAGVGRKRALACSSDMHVRTPNVTGMPVWRPTFIRPAETESEMASKW
eukprot:scaffold22743_cov28-Tisochrysis_lutea.AAC.2